MSDVGIGDEDRVALKLSRREWLVALLGTMLLLAVAPYIPFRPTSPVVPKDYRIPYSLSTRYALYGRYMTLAAAQFPTILLGDSVVWGQSSRRDQTLSHHLNELTQQPRFANGGVNGMHPMALLGLVEHHAPALERKDVLLQFNPLWLLTLSSKGGGGPGGLRNHPGLLPRLAPGFGGQAQAAILAAGARLWRRSPLEAWSERLAECRIDFLAWSLDHPYENPIRAITATLPPSEDTRPARVASWNALPIAPSEGVWGDPEHHPQWRAFERLISLLQLRNNRVFVLVGPMNEYMMSPVLRSSYAVLKDSLSMRLKSLNVSYALAPLPPSELYSDICHPLSAGYEWLAQDLLRSQSSWLLGLDHSK